MRDSGSLSTQEAVDKLVDAAKVIERRMGLKAAEEKRVNEAFELLASGPPSAHSKGAKGKEIYLDFLRRVQRILGLSKVVLLAAGLGLSAIVNAKDRFRVDLPFALKEQEKEFENGILHSIADSYSAKCEFGHICSMQVYLMCQKSSRPSRAIQCQNLLDKWSLNNLH